MKHFLLFLGILIIALSVYLSHEGFIIYQSLANNGGNNFENKIFMKHSTKNKKIAMVISFRDFRDIEYFIPKEVFESGGGEVKTISSKKGTAIGADGGEVKIDYTISEVNVKDFDAIVFIGGPGMSKNIDNVSFHDLAQEVVVEKKLLGGICIAPALLAKAGVLGGKEATVWSHYLTKEPINILKRSGVFYKDLDIVVDGNIVTANGPGAAEDWAVKIVEILSSEK
jgi:protease I